MVTNALLLVDVIIAAGSIINPAVALKALDDVAAVGEHRRNPDSLDQQRLPRAFGR
jgi:hypothetical protein